MFAENLDVFMRDFGVACSANGRSFTALLDTPDEQLNMAGVNLLSTMYLLTAKTSDITAATVASGTALTAAGTVYTVRDVMLEDDGALTKCTLSK